MSVRALENGFHPMAIGNGEPDQGWPCKKFKQEVAPMEEITSEPTLTIADVLDCLPEGKKMFAIVDRVMFKIHSSKNKQTLSNLFKQISLDNQDQLNKHPLEQKVQIFFALYKKMMIPIVEKDPEFSAILCDLQTQFPEEKNFLKSARDLADHEIYFLHAPYVQCVLLEWNSKITLRRETSPENAKIAEGLTVSKDAQKLFEAMLDT